MGAIEKNGYRFEIEYSVINQKGALHVYHYGAFIKEITFDYHGQSPSSEQVEQLVTQFIDEYS